MRLRDVLLGLIDLHPAATGYELKKIIGESTGYFFSASLGQIYPALRELADAGLVQFSADDTEGGRDRKRYTITDRGLAEFSAVLERLEPLPQSLAAFGQFLLHLTFIGRLEDQQIIAYIDTQLQHFRNERARVANDQLSIERRFLTATGAARERSLRLWEAEYQFLIDDLDRKVRWTEKLLTDARQAAGPEPGSRQQLPVS